jgi:photosystem II stability/assembly factor-like uncharacterized protein
MKRLVTVVVFLIFGNIANAQWTFVSPAPTTNYLYSVAYSSSSVGYAVGDFGTILYTADGGVNWSTQSSGVSTSLKCVFFLPGTTTGWIVGQSPNPASALTILHTTNGTSWSPITTTAVLNIVLRGVFFTDASNGWAVGDGGTILYSSNGGASWSQQTSNTTNELDDVYFTSSTTGWAVGKSGTIVQTTDGTTWSSQTVGSSSYDLRGVWFTGSTTGWAVSTGPAIFYTSDGSNWNLLSTGTSAITTPLYSVSFFDADNGIVVGKDGAIYSTTNGSNGTSSTWSSQTTSTNTNYKLYDIAIASSTTEAAVGYDGTNGLVEYNTNAGLPVELTSFSASVLNNSVKLSWKTATEVSNYGFVVERSSANSGWQKIGFVAGSGNSNSPKEYSFTDNPSGGTSFSYRLKQVDVDGAFKYYDGVTVNLTASTKPQLLQNSPNPFNPSTNIKFYIPNTSDVTIKIYDILGREVNTLINQQTTAGYHLVYWNGKDSRGEAVSSGVYIYRLTAGNFSETKKMNLLK